MAWSAVHAFGDWLQTNPPSKVAFQDWWDTHWNDYRTKCLNMATNIYIMEQATLCFKEAMRPDISFLEQLHCPALKAQIIDICTGMGTDSDEFFELGFKIYERKCKEIHQDYLAGLERR